MSRLRRYEARWTSSRLCATILFALAGWGSVYTALAQHPLPQGASVRTVFAAALVSGMFAGWINMRRSLGLGTWRAALGGVGAGVSGLLYFLLLAGFYDTVRSYRYTKFDSATDLLDHIVLRMLDVLDMALELQTFVTILVGSVMAGLYSDYVRRVWD